MSNKQKIKNRNRKLHNKEHSDLPIWLRILLLLCAIGLLLFILFGPKAIGLDWYPGKGFDNIK
ncbi:hypothetical protein [Dysgonomonas sp. BGC7]|uniref:hypothetical protein n=1 Tax=Dysgonomonas sp. BGC7 TaxID=1658008 RepID=UPI00067FBFCA|nr:hypothetical protein [Dysgonomonas sp. BGC7]